MGCTNPSFNFWLDSVNREVRYLCRFLFYFIILFLRCRCSLKHMGLSTPHSPDHTIGNKFLGRVIVIYMLGYDSLYGLCGCSSRLWWGWILPADTGISQTLRKVALKVWLMWLVRVLADGCYPMRLFTSPKKSISFRLDYRIFISGSRLDGTWAPTCHLLLRRQPERSRILVCEVALVGHLEGLLATTKSNPFLLTNPRNLAERRSLLWETLSCLVL